MGYTVTDIVKCDEWHLAVDKWTPLQIFMDTLSDEERHVFFECMTKVLNMTVNKIIELRQGKE